MAGTLRAEATLAAANLVYLLFLVSGGIAVPLDRFPEGAQPLLEAAARRSAVRGAARGAARRRQHAVVVGGRAGLSGRPSAASSRRAPSAGSDAARP